ncbi:hypothetical protein B1R94_27005 [Mycolicibacterium litorale]|nr:hypothetical protein B1R94_27005 [Mycolicibacterium litorale]
MSIAIANAPCSYGAFEVTIGTDPNVPDGVTLLDFVAKAGYEGIDLGPVGYLGTGDELSERLAQRGLALAGGYVPMAFSEPDVLAGEMDYIDKMCDVFDATPAGPKPPRPTLADAGSPERLARPGQAAKDRSLSLDDAGWARFGDGLNRVVDRFRARGYEPTFHHHTGTYVEAVWEVEKVLELSDVGFTLDTGHLLVGGGDPTQCLKDWTGRINHLHVKDVDRAILDEILAESGPMTEIWGRRAFCQFGQGDIDLDGFLTAVGEVGYDGWLVVEQDIFPRADEPADVPAKAQEANLAFLRARGL